jgi:hypothetical protein
MIQATLGYDAAKFAFPLRRKTLRPHRNDAPLCPTRAKEKR